MTTASALRNKRQVWGQCRRWEGNYLNQSQENPKSSVFSTSINNLKNTDHFQNVLFSSFILKTNKHNKNADRALLVTDNSIYKIDTNKFKPMKKGLPINQVRIAVFSPCFLQLFWTENDGALFVFQVTGISLSPGSDQLVVIHSNLGNDLVLSLHLNKINDDLVGELLGVLLTRFSQ